MHNFLWKKKSLEFFKCVATFCYFFKVAAMNFKTQFKLDLQINLISFWPRVRKPFGGGFNANEVPCTLQNHVVDHLKYEIIVRINLMMTWMDVRVHESLKRLAVSFTRRAIMAIFLNLNPTQDCCAKCTSKWKTMRMMTIAYSKLLFLLVSSSLSNFWWQDDMGKVVNTRLCILISYYSM